MGFCRAANGSNVSKTKLQYYIKVGISRDVTVCRVVGAT